MDQIEYRESKRQELIAIANSMLIGETQLIEGVRRLCDLRHAVGADHESFLPIRAVESETDHFVIGENQNNCTPSARAQINYEMESYLSEARPDILKACKELIRAFSKRE